ncbi:MAG: asparagine synthase B [Planctomycetota bacterium]
MCGIAGLWGGGDSDLVEAMKQAPVHRGPDAEGTYADRHGVLGHRRLSIMDPQGGNQPIACEDGRLTIVGNGEIYNFPRLRPELEASHTFATRSDTESALHLYQDIGTAAASKLDGMFALAIADGDKLFLARDPIGIKPLYMGRRGTSTVFASELKALAGHAEDVEEFPAGSFYHTDTGFQTYYSVPDVPVQKRSLDEHLQIVRKTLEQCVVKRLMSDVEVGAFLSGGLDSSLIAAIMKQHLDRMHTFSVGIEGSRDLEAARLVSKHIGSIHHEYAFTADEILEHLPEILYHLESFDRDLVRSAIPCFFVSRLAAEHLKVIHTGEGADELFAGYTYYKDIDDEQVLHDELRRSVMSLHNINLQRVDRLTMAHSLEARVPFLDTDMIAVAQTIPARLKQFDPTTGKRVEKWILRKACEDLLPDEIVWRDKEQFDEGSGTVDIVDRLLAEQMPPEQAADYRKQHPDAVLRSDEECLYHRILAEQFDNSPVVLGNVAHWSMRPDHINN